MFRRLFSRGSREPHRADHPTVEARASDGQIEVTVRNNDLLTADSPRLVLMLASGETSEHDRAEIDLEPIDPDGRGVAVVETTRKSVYRVWWFLTWQADGVAQQASGSVDVQ